MRCLGARTCPSPRPTPLPSRLWAPACAVNKTRGLCHVHGPGEEVSPRPCCVEDSEPLGPCVSAFRFRPLFSGDLGGPACCPPLLSSLLHAAMFLCCQIGPLRPSSALGVGTGFLLSHALDSPSLGTVDTQVPCIQPSLLASFPRSRLT